MATLPLGAACSADAAGTFSVEIIDGTGTIDSACVSFDARPPHMRVSGATLAYLASQGVTTGLAQDLASPQQQQQRQQRVCRHCYCSAVNAAAALLPLVSP